MLEVDVLVVESPPFQNHEVRLEPVAPLVVLADESGEDLLVAFKNVSGTEGGARLKAKPLCNTPLGHFVAIGVLKDLQEEIHLW